jgi:hypothetical protein
VKELRRAQHNFKPVVHIVQEVFWVNEAHCFARRLSVTSWLAGTMP